MSHSCASTICHSSDAWAAERLRLEASLMRVVTMPVLHRARSWCAPNRDHHTPANALEMVPFKFLHAITLQDQSWTLPSLSESHGCPECQREPAINLA